MVGRESRKKGEMPREVARKPPYHAAGVVRKWRREIDAASWRICDLRKLTPQKHRVEIDGGEI
jgi:hypothetical protein